MHKAIGAALLVGGLLLLFFGFQEYQSLQSEMKEFLTGSPTDRALWLMVGGAVAGVAGLVLLVRPGR